MEVSHLKLAAKHLKRYEKKTEKDLFNKPEFPKLLIFGENKEYIRKVIKDTINNTSYYEDSIDVKKLDDKKRFCFYQSVVNESDDMVASHKVIDEIIDRFNEDYRYEDEPHPINELQDFTKDNIDIARP